MKSSEPPLSAPTTSPWEMSLARLIHPVEWVSLEQISPSDAALLQDEAVTRTISILRDKISGS